MAIRFHLDDNGTPVDPDDDDTIDNDQDDVPVLELVNTTGSLTHNTDTTTISDGVLEDQTVTLDTQDTGFSETYDYVTAYEVKYTSDGVDYESFGVSGIVTRTDDVPTSGEASYTGEATASVLTFDPDSVFVEPENDITLSSGTSMVEADFGAGTVDVTMNGFTATYEDDDGNNQSATSPIDTITITGMTIAGNAFSGGDLTTTGSGNTVVVTGDNTETSAGGNFFGYDGTNAIPDETAGVLLSEGDSGTVGATFIAD